MEDIRKNKSVEVFTGSPWEAEILKRLLENNDIQCVLKDGIIGTLLPFASPTVSILVREDQFEIALDLIDKHESE